jgi:Rad3-related DNA helicase
MAANNENESKEGKESAENTENHENKMDEKADEGVVQEEKGSRSSEIEVCSFYEDFEREGRESSMQGVFSLHDMKQLGKERNWCPYFTARHLVSLANVVVYNYQYLLDPKISGLVSNEIASNSIIVFDEAHNIDSICISEGTLITLASGVSGPIELLGGLPNVCAYDTSRNGLIHSKVSQHLDNGEKDCVELIFEDGRSLVCTANHKLLTSENEWITAEELEVDLHRIKMGIEAPRDWDYSDPTSSDPSTDWKLTLNSGLGWELELSAIAQRRVALAFFRLIGLLLTAGSVTYDAAKRCNGAFVIVGTDLDAAAVVADLQLITGTKPAITPQNRCVKILINREFAAALCNLDECFSGVNRRDEGFILPACVLGSNLPKPLLREFLAGLMGGAGYSPVFDQQKNCLTSAGFAIPKYPAHLTADNLAADLTSLIQLFNEFNVAAALGSPVNIAIVNVIEFTETIGIRYCASKAVRFCAATAFTRYRQKCNDIPTVHEAIEFGAAEYQANKVSLDNFTSGDQREWLQSSGIYQLLERSEESDEDYCTTEQQSVISSFHLKLIQRRAAGKRRVFDLTVDRRYQSFLANGVVVHNCIEALSVSIDHRTVQAANNNLNKLQTEVNRMERTDSARLQEEYKNLLQGLNLNHPSSGVADADNLMSSPVLNQDLLREAIPGSIRRAKHFLMFLRTWIEYLKQRLLGRVVTSESPSAFIQHLQNETKMQEVTALKHSFERLNSLFKTLKVTDLDDFTPIVTLTHFATLLASYSEGFIILFEPFDDRTPLIPDPKLQLACLDASIAIKPVFDKFYSVIITSGTLSPLSVYPRMLNFRPAITASFSMSLARNCIEPLIVTRGSDQVPISSKFDLRGDTAVLANYGRLLIELAEIVPDGIVCFFTSYSYMEEVIAKWKESNVLDDLLKHKLIFIETKDIVETTLSLDAYKRACSVGRGAIFFSVARGKVAEGIDFDRHYGRCVVMFGIPFQYTLSRVLRARLEYLREHFQLSEADFLSFDALRQVAQCFPADHQILTRSGFKWVNDSGLEGDEIASYNPETQQIEYHRGSWVHNPPAPVNLVHVFDENDVDRWDNNLADEYGVYRNDTEASCKEHQSKRGNHINLTTTDDHKWFVKMNNVQATVAAGRNSDPAYCAGGKNESQWGFELASDLVQAQQSDGKGENSNCFKLLCAAANGIANNSQQVGTSAWGLGELGIESREHLEAFSWLYGYWLGDGTLEVKETKHKGSPGVVFISNKQPDYDEIMKRLNILGLVQGQGSKHNQVWDYSYCTGKSGRHYFSIVNKHYYDWYYSEYGRKYIELDLTLDLDTVTEDLLVVLLLKIKSAKWFASVMWQLDRDLLRALIDGLISANGGSRSKDCIFTSSVDFRDRLIQLLLHAGYSAYFTLEYKAGTQQVWHTDEQGNLSTPTRAKHDSWRIQLQHGMTACEPVIRVKNQVTVNSQQVIPTYCVTVPPHHLIIARKAASTTVNGKQIVAKASKPVIIGQCAGRVIRSKSDYGIMIFADIRYSRSDKRDKLPAWIRQYLNKSNINLSTDRAITAARVFLKKMAQPRKPAEELGITMLNQEQINEIIAKQRQQALIAATPTGLTLGSDNNINNNNTSNSNYNNISNNNTAGAPSGMDLTS